MAGLESPSPEYGVSGSLRGNVLNDGEGECSVKEEFRGWRSERSWKNSFCGLGMV